MEELKIHPLGQVVSGVLKEIGLTTDNFAVAALIEKELERITPRARIVGFKKNKVSI